MADERVCTKYRTETNSLHLALILFHLSSTVLDLGLPELHDTTTNQTDRIDPSRAPTKSALKFVGFLGISAGFMLAYQRSSCECLFC